MTTSIPKINAGIAGTPPHQRAMLVLMWNQLPVLERLQLQSDIDPNGCWVMRKAKTHGYSEIMYEGKRQRAHRVSWKIHNGPIPPGMMVCHECNNPPCWRPDHLFLGTNKRNQDHSYKTGLVQRGENHFNAKLTQAQADEMRRLFATGEYTKTALSKMFEINRERVWRIVKGEIYVN